MHATILRIFPMIALSYWGTPVVLPTEIRSVHMVNEALSEADVRMKGAVRAFEDDLASIRTGRASPALVDRLLVEYYGTPTSLM